MGRTTTYRTKDSARGRPAIGGIVGPLAFIAAWSILGTGRRGYSPVDDPISRLAAVDASSRPAMTAGFLAFGAGVSLFASALRPALPASAASAATTAVATVGVAALPLGASLGGAPHAAAAGLAYTALAATPMLAARTFEARGQRAAALLSLVGSVVCGAALLGSALVDTRVGLFQRVGLTVGDAWIVATAVWLLRPPESASGSD